MDTTVMLGHGSGGTMMKRIIDDVFFAAYAGDELLRGDDAAVLPAPAPGERLAFSTDSFVVTPHFFPGGDIGRLAVCGTVNDVATSGAVPRYLSCGFVLEEGFPIEDLKRICASMAECAQEAGVHLVTGDTKVVNRGHGDGVYINTSGVGTIPEGVNLGGAQCKPGDKVLVTGTLGDHGITIMSCRESLSFSADLESDAAPLNHLIAEVLAAAPNTRHAERAGCPVEHGHHGGGRRHPREAGRAGRVRDAGLRRAAGGERGQDGVRCGGRGGRRGARGHAREPVRRRCGHHRRSVGRPSRARLQGVPAHGVRRHAHPRHAGGRAIAAHLLEALHAAPSCVWKRALTCAKTFDSAFRGMKAAALSIENLPPHPEKFAISSCICGQQWYLAGIKFLGK